MDGTCAVAERLNMRILILGGTKFVGPHVVQYLVDLGHEVAIFHRGASLGAIVHHNHRRTGVIGTELCSDGAVTIAQASDFGNSFRI